MGMSNDTPWANVRADSPLPHDLESERAVLGSCLRLGSLPEGDVVAGLRPCDFWRDAHRVVFRVMRDLSADGTKIDLLTIKSRLSLKELEDVGGPAYIAALADGVPSSTNSIAYAGIVRERADARAMLVELERARHRLYSEPSAAGNGLASDLCTALEAIREGSDTRQDDLQLVDDLEMIARPEPAALVMGMLISGSLVGLYGPTGVGKTFTAIQLGICICTGRSFLGAPVPEPGNVVHVLAEGAGRFGARLRAAKRSLGLAVDESLGYYTLPKEVDLMNRTAVNRLIVEARPVSPRLVIIDTVNRNMGGNENSSEDMAQFVASCDRIRSSLGTTVLLVHHTGWEQSRERGSSVLRAAVDTWMSLKGVGSVILSCEKQRDLDEFPPISLRLVSAHGSAIMELAESSADPPLTKADRLVLEVLPTDGATKAGWVKAVMSRQGAPHRSTAYKVVARLVEQGWVRRDGKLYRPFGDHDAL